jgi:hypothetical protein
MPITTTTRMIKATQATENSVNVVSSGSVVLSPNLLSAGVLSFVSVNLNP